MVRRWRTPASLRLTFRAQLFSLRTFRARKDDLAAIEATWRECATDSTKIERAEYEREHAEFLRDLVCNAAENRKEIAAGIIKNWISVGGIRSDYFSEHAREELARGLLGLDGKDCSATKELREEVKDYLRGRASGQP
jgi:hypothetical protein